MSSYFSKYMARVEQTNKLVNNTKLTNSNLFESHPFYSLVDIDGIQSGVIVVQEKTSDDKKVLLKPDTKLNIGSVIKINNTNYLTMDFLGEGINEIYPTATLKLCNSLFPIQSNKTRVLMRDANGNVLYDDFTGEALTTETVESTTIPCIVENKYRVNDNNDQMWLPENEIMVTLPYRSELKVGYKFEMYLEKYEVVNVDWTKVLNGKGILTLRAKKEVGS